MSLNTRMLQPGADSTGYWLVWGLVLTGKWVKEAGFSGWCGVGLQLERGKKGRNAAAMAVVVIGKGC